MILYLAIKWSELIEGRDDKTNIKSSEHAHEYALISILAIWTITIKLSSASFILLAIYPAILLIRHKKWRALTGYLLAGILIILPFLVRNAIISGYLLYPYASLDFFDFDWKMPRGVVSYDSLEIMAYGRSIYNHAEYSAPFTVWFLNWYNELILRYRMLFWLNPPIIMAIFPYLIALIRKRNEFPRIMLIIACSTSLLFWFFTSPLIRYGMVYLMLLPILFAGIIIEKLTRKYWGILIAGIVLSYSALSMIRHLEIQGTVHPMYPQDYPAWEYDAVEWESITMYLPARDDRIGYHHFPSSPDIYRLDSAQMRSGSMRDGFRAKAH
jgi:hypothetical protein